MELNIDIKNRRNIRKSLPIYKKYIIKLRRGVKNELYI